MSAKGKSHLLTGMFIGTVLGGMYSMLFAAKKGSVVRDELRKAHEKGKPMLDIIGKELSLTGKESIKALKELFESDGFQEFMAESKKRMDEIMEQAKKKGTAYSQELRKKFEYLAHIASKKAEEIEEEEEESDRGTKTSTAVKKKTKRGTGFHRKTIKK